MGWDGLEERLTKMGKGETSQTQNSPFSVLKIMFSKETLFGYQRYGYKEYECRISAHLLTIQFIERSRNRKTLLKLPQEVSVFFHYSLIYLPCIIMISHPS